MQSITTFLISNRNINILLSATEGRITWCGPIQATKFNQVLNKAYDHTQRELKQGFDHQTTLNGCIRIGLLSYLFTLLLRIPLSIGIKPDREISPTHQSLIVRRSIVCTIYFRYRLIHLRIILWNKPLGEVVQQSPL